MVLSFCAVVWWMGYPQTRTVAATALLVLCSIAKSRVKKVLLVIYRCCYCEWVVFWVFFFLVFFFLILLKALTFYLFIYLFIYFWLCWVFVSVRGLSLVAASGGHPSSQCVGLSLSRPLLLWSTSSRRTGSVVVAHGPSCSAACGIFPDQGLNPCPLHWQADSQPLGHQGSPGLFLFLFLFLSLI